MDLRCFIAIELPEELKRNVDVYIEKLRSTGADVKWIPANNLHFTLKFLGKTSEELLEEIDRKLFSIAKTYEAFGIRLFGAGVFPGEKRPRVVWLGIQDSANMIRLQRDIDKSMAELGFEKEDREFKVHLTLGRVRSFKNIGLLIKEIATLKNVDFGKIDVKSIALMKSELKRTGAEYFRLSEIPIGKETVI